ncbi:unnamed protein product [Mesocestoides corti]|uniref:Histone-lysine N-methyltransferase n=1 Tax=Mesocestoides corti TaxID=53468 RepID=A0A3P6HV19_MESCO|nr:unnamed protein product [Mesocestoides corti]
MLITSHLTGASFYNQANIHPDIRVFNLIQKSLILLLQMLYDPTVTEAFINSPNPGCDCVDACSDPLVCACLIRSRGRNYDPDANILLQLQSPQSSFDRPVYECNSRCACRKDKCHNRLVQLLHRNKGALVPYNAEAKGRGVRASRAFCRGEFVCVFSGHYMKPDIELAQALASKQRRRWHNVYIMVVREIVVDTFQDAFTTIVNGAHKVRSVHTGLRRTSLINHSCNPNMQVIPVRVDTVQPFLAFFAIRDIAEGEELTYDYFKMSREKTVRGAKACRCGTLPCSRRVRKFCFISVRIVNMHCLLRLFCGSKFAINDTGRVNRKCVMWGSSF